jgi:M6 family metalloprotease-like protein
MSARRLTLLFFLAALGAAVTIDGPYSTQAAPATADPTSATACDPPRLGRGTGEGRNDPNQFPPTVGDLRIGMLFVEFADREAASDPRAIYETVIPRVVDWYRDVSYGRVRLEVTPLLRWLRLPQSLARYTGPGLDVGFRVALEEAVAAADADLDFSRFQALYLVIPGEAFDAVGPVGVLISEQPLHVDGVELGIWAWLHEGTGFLEPHTYFAHETGHILGLPDLYVAGAPASNHRWDIMASARLPRGLFAWHRWKLGWLDEGQIACLSTGRRIEATLSPLERAGGTKAIIVPRGRFAYVAEVRLPVASSQGDACKGGVLIYAVEFGAPAGSPDIRVRRAKFDTTALRVRCGPLAAAPFGHGRGEVSRVRSWGLQFDVVAAHRDNSFRVRVTKTKRFRD